jgi:hypothetical protein
MRKIMVLAAAAALAGAGCSKRTTAALNPNGPKLFDVAGSDPKAVAIADQVLAAVGADKYEKTHEFVWTEMVVDEGKPIFTFKHAWDRWNGRHRMSWQDAAGTVIVGMYEIWGSVATAMANGEQLAAGNTKDVVAEAKKRWPSAVHALFLPFLLKHPGAKLAYVEERPWIPPMAGEEPPAVEEGKTPEMKYDVIKLTFAPGTGTAPGDEYYLLVNKESHMIDAIEFKPDGKPPEHRLGYKMAEWQDVGGMKFCVKRVNIGRPAEVWSFTGIEAHGSANEDLYVPVVR